MDRLRVGVDLGTEVTKYGEARLGLAGGAAVTEGWRAAPRCSTSETRAFDQAGVTVRVVFDQLDNVNFPRSGVLASGEIFASRRDLGARDDYTRWDLAAQGATAHRRQHLRPSACAAPARSTTDCRPTTWCSGAASCASRATRSNSLIGQSLSFGRLVYAYKLVDQKVFDGVYAGFSVEGGRMSEDRCCPTSRTASSPRAALFLAVDSPLGPFYLAWGRSSDGASSAYIFLGRP